MEDKESTLTAPEDRNTNVKFHLDVAPPLNEEQVTEAMKSLRVSSYIERFPRLEREYADPQVDFQKIGLVSFVPAKGATPNEKGVFGFAKLRGNYPSLEEADHRAEFLVRNVDSYHKLYYAPVGKPFPCTLSSDFSANVKKIDLQQEMTTAYAESVK